MSSAQIVSASVMHKQSLMGGLHHAPPPPVSGYPPAQFWQPGLHHPVHSQHEDIKPFAHHFPPPLPPPPPPHHADTKPPPVMAPQPPPSPPWLTRSIATNRLRLLEHSAYVENQSEQDSYQKHLFVHIGSGVSYSDPPLEPVDVRQIQDKFPEKSDGLKELYGKGPQDAFFLVKFWADLNSEISDESNAFHGVTSTYESTENMTIQVSTKVCSFGKQVVEKVETEYARYEGGRYLYKIHRNPMCEYMINFILKLKHLPEKYMMNSVLENFTILQVITNRDTRETLLCIAYVFEVSTSEHGAQHHIYKLVKDP